MRAGAALLIAGTGILQACGNSTAPTSITKPPPLETTCVSSALKADTTYTGVLDSAIACRRSNPLTGESTFTNSYALAIVSGHGYLVTMAGHGTLNSLLELGTASSPETILAASRGSGPRAQLLFASGSTVTDTIRVTTVDSAPADTGSYDLFVQSCKVPVPPVTDSITHTDTTNVGDCQVNLSEFPFNDVNLSYVHLYALHVTADTLRRLISFTASGPSKIFIGGPHYDTFETTGGSTVASFDTATTANTFYFVAGSGDYTLVIGADQSPPVGVSYTLTIGSEQPIP